MLDLKCGQPDDFGDLQNQTPSCRQQRLQIDSLTFPEPVQVFCYKLAVALYCQYYFSHTIPPLFDDAKSFSQSSYTPIILRLVVRAGFGQEVEPLDRFPVRFRGQTWTPAVHSPSNNTPRARLWVFSTIPPGSSIVVHLKMERFCRTRRVERSSPPSPLPRVRPITNKFRSEWGGCWGFTGFLPIGGHTGSATAVSCL